MLKFKNSILVIYLIIFLESYFCISLFNNGPFPREFTKTVEKHLGEDYGARDVAVFKQIIKNFKYNDQVFTPSEEEELKISMKKYVGPKFIEEYEYLMNEEFVDSNKEMAKSMINLIKQQFIKLKEIETQYISPNIEQYNEINLIKNDLSKSSELITLSDLNTDTPCNTELECRKLQNMMNICTYIRNSADFAYDIFLVTTHIVTTMMSIMCACLFIGPVHICALKNFPYTCKLPYPVFSTLFMTTSTIWQIVKATTSLCRVYGDISIMSKMK